MTTAIAKPTTTQQKGGNPRKTLDQQQQQQQPPSDPVPDKDGGDESKPSVVKEVAADKKDEAPVTSFQKKIRRAERFGMPILLSEEEKRNSRAERWEWVSKNEAIQMAEDAKLDLVMFSYLWREGMVQL